MRRVVWPWLALAAALAASPLACANGCPEVVPSGGLETPGPYPPNPPQTRPEVPSDGGQGGSQGGRQY